MTGTYYIFYTYINNAINYPKRIKSVAYESFPYVKIIKSMDILNI